MSPVTNGQFLKAIPPGLGHGSVLVSGFLLYCRAHHKGPGRLHYHFCWSWPSQWGLGALEVDWIKTAGSQATTFTVEWPAGDI